jgi:hypothetical protein
MWRRGDWDTFRRAWRHEERNSSKKYIMGRGLPTYRREYPKPNGLSQIFDDRGCRMTDIIVLQPNDWAL